MPPSHLVRFPSYLGHNTYRNIMRTFNVSFLAVLSCIAMIGATPVSPDPGPYYLPKVSTYAKYVALQQLMEVLT